MRSVVVVVLFAFACSSKKTEPPAGSSTPSGSADKGSATVASGSSDKGSADNGSAAVASGSDAGSGSGSAVATGSASGSGGDFDFKKLTQEQKLDFMKKTVVPTMKPLFVDFDKKKFAETGSAPFGCKTCHGKDPRGTKYKMPSADVPKLDFAKLEAGKQEPKTAKWMAEVVKPQMAKLLQLPEMTETNHTGFGCLACHLQKK